MQWLVLLPIAVVAIMAIALIRPAASPRISGSDRNTPAPKTAPVSTLDVVAQPLPQLGKTDPAPYISRLINSDSTKLPDYPTGVTTYIVQSGDFLFSIAEKFNIQPETILWSNYDVLKDNPELIMPGQALYILPVDGLYYQWQTGDRLDTVAKLFGVTPEDIIFWPGNNLSPTVDVLNPGITPGTWLVVPGGSRAFKEWEVPIIRKGDVNRKVGGGAGACTTGPYSGPAGTGFWTWPTESHWICGNKYSAYHHGIDLYVPMHGPVYAADRGVVVWAGQNDIGFGNLVVIDHGNDWQTLYGHLSRVDVGCGDTVQRGSVIGLGGSTGNSTGPHLHFEMIFNGLRVNPSKYLP
jgi:LysM repeat protein